MLIALTLLAAAQGLPPANPLPYQDDQAAAVLAPINALFAAFEAGDAPAMLRLVYPDGRVTAVGLPSGLRQQSWTQFAERVTPARPFQERISDPAIDVDGDIAMVWAPFVVRIDGKSPIAAMIISISSGRMARGRS